MGCLRTRLSFSGAERASSAHRLRRGLAAEDRVVLVEREPLYRFAPSFLWVRTGERRPEQINADLRRRGIELVEARHARSIQPRRAYRSRSVIRARSEVLVGGLGGEGRAFSSP